MKYSMTLINIQLDTDKTYCWAEFQGDNGRSITMRMTVASLVGHSIGSTVTVSVTF